MQDRLHNRCRTTARNPQHQPHREHFRQSLTSIRGVVQTLHGRVKSRILEGYRLINRFVVDGTSTNAKMMGSVIGSTICVTTSDATKITDVSPTQPDNHPQTKLPDNIESLTKEWLSRELTSNEIGVRKYKRGYEWDWTKATGYSNAIDSSLYAAPLDLPPPIESNTRAKYALRQYKDLFSIECKVDAKMFAFILQDHPNQPFVKSVIEGLSNGFWPMSEVPPENTVFVTNHKICESFPGLLEAARDEEVAEGRYSKGFHTLLPGMKVSPLLLVSKKGSTKMRVCTDMSYGKPSLNDSIISDRVKVSFDSLILFAPYIVDLAKRGIKIVVWKSDVQNAYRLLGMALMWQLRQIVKVGETFHVDKCASFGSSASPKIWVSFFSLVLWIARTRLGLSHINNLMDDTWGVCPASSMVTFKGHQIPLDQAKLLMLFDLLNIPWEWKKQLHGTELEIIGHLVLANELMFTLPSDKKNDLVAALRNFTSANSRTLREWQSMLGWASWGLNSFPMGRWALQSSWDKISGKSHKNLVVPHNANIQRDLRWLADELEVSDGNLLLESCVWSFKEADFVATADACGSGLGFWLPNSAEGFYTPLSLPSRDIYWAELAASSHAILLGIERGAKRLLICADSSNVCDLFLSHRAVEKVRDLFQAIISKIIHAKVDVRIAHIPGKKNIFADALSRRELHKVYEALSFAKVTQFTPFLELPEGGFPSSHKINVIPLPKRSTDRYRGVRR